MAHQSGIIYLIVPDFMQNNYVHVQYTFFFFRLSITNLFRNFSKKLWPPPTQFGYADAILRHHVVVMIVVEALIQTFQKKNIVIMHKNYNYRIYV